MAFKYTVDVQLLQEAKELFNDLLVDFGDCTCSGEYLIRAVRDPSCIYHKYEHIIKQISEWNHKYNGI